ncbi:MAG: crtE [Candidatus Saccharibacteria bacterium]|nr:crtE [Candidatus Saccharibacteria bacterium]
MRDSSKQQIEAFIAQLLASKSAQAQAIGPAYADLLEQIAVLIARGGKRMRPELVIRAYTAYGGKKSDAIIPVAASQELFHAFILVHDDIIDRDVVRWGGPNISGHYYEELRKTIKDSEAHHYANAWALLAGDICHNLSHEVLLASDFPATDLLRAAALVHQTTFSVVGGELADTALPLGTTWEETDDDTHLLHVSQTKTAAYSFSTPLQLGALLAGASQPQLDQLERFGAHIGTAFQLRDDILGIFGDEQRLGKSTLSDIREGKRTLLMSYGLRLSSQTDRQKLLDILGNPLATRVQLNSVQQILQKNGAHTKVEALIGDYCAAAVTVLQEVGMPVQLKTYLTELVLYCGKRWQ